MKFLTPLVECKVYYLIIYVKFKGWRLNMEDSHIADLTSLGKGKYIFGVFDGHGGLNICKLFNLYRYGSSRVC